MMFDDADAATSVPLSSTKFCVVDVETSGLKPERDRLLQIAAIVITGDGTVIDQWSSLVRPRNRWFFPVGPRHIHGITRRSLRSAPPLAAVLVQLQQRLIDARFTAHNAQFDAAFVRNAARSADVSISLPEPLCTLTLSRQLDPDRNQSHRLADLCQRYQVPLDRPHDALQDALATATVLPHLFRAHNVTTTQQLAALMNP